MRPVALRAVVGAMSAEPRLRPELICTRACPLCRSVGVRTTAPAEGHWVELYSHASVELHSHASVELNSHAPIELHSHASIEMGERRLYMTVAARVEL